MIDGSKGVTATSSCFVERFILSYLQHPWGGATRRGRSMVERRVGVGKKDRVMSAPCSPVRDSGAARTVRRTGHGGGRGGGEHGSLSGRGCCDLQRN